MEDLITLIEDWCAIPSGSGDPEGLAEMHAAVAAHLAPLNCAIQDVPLAGGSPALLATMRPEAPLQVLLSGHLDTVYGREQRGARREGGRLVGPGTADMKGGLAVMIAALQRFEATPEASALGWRVVVTPDEEIGSPHSAQLLRELARSSSVGFVMEPAADGGLVRSRKGVGVFRLVVHGRAAHAGRNPEDGRNAVLALAELVMHVASLHDPARGILVNPARLGGGGATNVVPEFAVAEVDIRVARGSQAIEIPRRLDHFAAEVATHHDLDVQVEGRFHRPPMPSTPGSEALLKGARECGALLGLRLEGADVGGGSDAALLADEGLPVLDGLGVRGGGMHSPDEYLEIDSLTERTLLLACLLTRLAKAEIWLPEWGRR
ncbi:MAG: hydrolase [Thermoleophilia bacterium]